MKFIFFILPIFAVSFIPCFAQNWQLSKDENGIKVYTGTSDSSRYKLIKVEAVIVGTIKKLTNILMNVKDNRDWVYDTKQSYIVQTVSENEFLYYAETHLPWPLSNRDVVIRMHFYPDTIKNALKITQKGEPNAVPLVDGKVRVVNFNASWDVQSVSEDKIMIIYVLEVSPGGNISPGLSNLFATKGPFETFNNLSNLLSKQ